MARTITFQSAGNHSRPTVRSFSGDHAVETGSAYAMYTSDWALGAEDKVESELATACSGGSVPCPCGVTL